MRFTKLLTNVSEVRLKFPKFATNLAISLRSCQSNCELGNEVVNFSTNFVGKLRSSSRATSAPFGVNVSEFYLKLWLRRLRITGFKMGYKTLKIKFSQMSPDTSLKRIQLLSCELLRIVA